LSDKQIRIPILIEISRHKMRDGRMLGQVRKRHSLEMPSLINEKHGVQGVVLGGGVGSTFEPLSSTASGIRIDAEQQGVWVGDANGDQRPDLWIQHSGTIELYLNQHGL
jgi:hypothetical protein